MAAGLSDFPPPKLVQHLDSSRWEISFFPNFIDLYIWIAEHSIEYLESSLLLSFGVRSTIGTRQDVFRSIMFPHCESLLEK
jgi:hypothetical protein